MEYCFDVKVYINGKLMPDMERIYKDYQHAIAYAEFLFLKLEYSSDVVSVCIRKW